MFEINFTCFNRYAFEQKYSRRDICVFSDLRMFAMFTFHFLFIKKRGDEKSCIKLLYSIYFQANINNTRLLKVPYSEVYIYSAVAVFVHHSFEEAEDAKENNRFNAIAINAFEIGNDSGSPFRCCYLYQNRTVASSESSSRHIYPAKAIRRGRQLICPLNQSPYDIRGVSVMFKNTVCSKENQFYTSIVIPTLPSKKNKSEKSIGVCLKVAYGDLDPGMLVEWLEALRLLGVDTIFAHFHKLSTSARKIFQVYVKTGFVETVEFELPLHGTFC